MTQKIFEIQETFHPTKYYPNTIVQQQLLDCLAPEKTNVVVKKNKSYGDGVHYFEADQYICKNSHEVEMFVLSRKRLASSFEISLIVKDIMIQYDTKDGLVPRVRDFDNFIGNLERALNRKISCQTVAQELEIAKSHLCYTDRMIMKHLSLTSQR